MLIRRSRRARRRPTRSWSPGRWAGLAAAVLVASSGVAAPAVAQDRDPRPGRELTVRQVGNAGVVVTDGEVSLLVDLPHEPGAYGYATYNPSELRPPGQVVSVITHDHEDHFASELFMERDGWQIVGAQNVLRGLPPQRVLAGDTVVVGSFTIVAVATSHSDGHRSYSIRWRGRSIHVTGDTEDGGFALTGPAPDVLFITPWLACTLFDAGRRPEADRTILYHLRPDGSDRPCTSAEVLPPEATIRLPGS